MRLESHFEVDRTAGQEYLEIKVSSPSGGLALPGLNRKV